jgi:hypothetical protein
LAVVLALSILGYASTLSTRQGTYSFNVSPADYSVWTAEYNGTELLNASTPTFSVDLGNVANGTILTEVLWFENDGGYRLNVTITDSVLVNCTVSWINTNFTLPVANSTRINDDVTITVLGTGEYTALFSANTY